MHQTLSDFRKTNNSFATKRASGAGLTPLTEGPELPSIRRNFKMRHGSLRGSTSPRHISPRYSKQFKMHSSRLPPKPKVQNDNKLTRIEEDQISAIMSSRQAKYLENTVDADAEILYDQSTQRLCRKQPNIVSTSNQILLKSGAGAPIGSAPRVSLYRARIELDDLGTRMNLDLQKDNKKMYIVIYDPETFLKKEMELFIKQATQVLMYCHNDFRRFVAEIICVKHNRITLRDINKVIENLTN